MTNLAIYIHWPFCKAKCPYCDFNSHVRDTVEADAWKQALLTELEHMAAQAGPRQVGSIFFGGGTPSLMPPGIPAALIERIAKRFTLLPDAEITLEANPTSVEADKFQSFRAAGVNRVSLGVQALNAADLVFLGRQHSADEALRAIELAASIFPRYSFDLIYARPNQTLENWEVELTQALALTRGHISLYQLTIEENTAFHYAYAKGGFVLPDEETAAALYELTERITSNHGLNAYEVSNYAALGQESRHNLAYWRSNDYLGIGPGAHGRLTTSEGRIASQTIRSPERWLEQVTRDSHGLEAWTLLTERETLEERVMMGLRLSEGMPLNGLILPGLERLVAGGLLEAANDRVRTTKQGRLVLNTVTAQLLA